MAWEQIHLDVPRADATRAELALTEAGALAVTLMDSADNPVLEPGVGETPLWPEVTLTGLFAAGKVNPDLVAALLTAAGLKRPDRLQSVVLPEQDWERAWLDRFKPTQFGSSLWIVPRGLEPPEPEATILYLDPGLAFGTGTHPTTALCLEWLDLNPPAGSRVLDFGSGSGVLAVAAALKGAAAVTAVDNDPQAITATKQNAVGNQVENVVTALLDREFVASPYELVVANILAQPLIELADLLAGCLTAGGTLLLSGLLEGQGCAVMGAYEAHIEWKPPVERDGWLRLEGRKRG